MIHVFYADVYILSKPTTFCGNFFRAFRWRRISTKSDVVVRPPLSRSPKCSCHRVDRLCSCDIVYWVKRWELNYPHTSFGLVGCFFFSEQQILAIENLLLQYYCVKGENDVRYDVTQSANRGHRQHLFSEFADKSIRNSMSLLHVLY